MLQVLHPLGACPHATKTILALLAQVFCISGSLVLISFLGLCPKLGLQEIIYFILFYFYKFISTFVFKFPLQTGKFKPATSHPIGRLALAVQ
jgi:hypothetical protein